LKGVVIPRHSASKIDFVALISFECNTLAEYAAHVIEKGDNEPLEVIIPYLKEYPID
jgi:hypothetical protein